MKIAIAGYGVEGESNYNYWNTPDNELTIVDERETPTHGLPADVKNTILGPGSFQQLDGFDMVIRTAGLAPDKIKTRGKIWSSTNEFFKECPAPIIGVTGTKGKGTTSSLIAAIFEAAGKKVWLVGNIGKAPLEIMDQVQSSDIIVFELSSFQLWDLERSPQTAVVLMIEADHLDVHKDMQDYVTAKANIRIHQKDGDICVYHPTNTYSSEIAHTITSGKLLRYGIPDDGAVYERDGTFYQGEQIICSTSLLQTPGAHNIDNACAALTVALQHGVHIGAVESALRTFKGLAHRLSFVADNRGVRFYDDSIATTPGSAIAALAAFPQPKILILGGSSKGVDFAQLASAVAHTNTKAVILIGNEAPHIQQALEATNYQSIYNLGTQVTMTDIVAKSVELATAGDTVILSPSCASFDMFENYADRGDQFIESVNKLTE